MRSSQLSHRLAEVEASAPHRGLGLEGVPLPPCHLLRGHAGVLLLHVEVLLEDTHGLGKGKVGGGRMSVCVCM